MALQHHMGFMNPNQPIFLDYLIVAGGGGGGNTINIGNFPAGGGGAGGFLSGSVTLYTTKNTTYSITVGVGGITGSANPYCSSSQAGITSGSTGGNSQFLDFISIGGGGGGAMARNPFGIGTPVSLSGGSGGGAGYQTGAGNSISSSAQRQGFRGAASNNINIPGCGGGAGGAGIAGTQIGGIVTPGQPGPPLAWVDGRFYAGGGVSKQNYTGTFATGSNYNYISGSGGSGIWGSGSNFSCDAPGPDNAISASGQNGIVAIRYPGETIKLAGGEIIISGSYVYHYFPSSSTFTIL